MIVPPDMMHYWGRNLYEVCEEARLYDEGSKREYHRCLWWPISGHTWKEKTIDLCIADFPL